ncbi:DUF1684 domain-containing protein [Oerskovia sp. Sa1BUA8]|uniref:DUF1684 domain-containing protein n=1 Tax=Oerskovia douganii TaxID=2762210 RepID=A0A9D5YYY7_9CELL|nr:DUF1684 domain-containing protein [Oerskovia douganii]MBE7701183.1 DUF1684 domain-containing protein [Oerskovia douganii]
MTTSTTSPAGATTRGRHAASAPTAAPTETAGAPAGAAVAAWSAWHAERERTLREQHGWLTLTSLHWVPGSPTSFPGLPGEWWSDADGVHLRAAAADGIVPSGGQDALRGTHVQDVAEGASAFVATFVPDGADPASSVAVELVRRTGRYGLRVRDPRARTRVAFEGVPTFAYDPSWVLDVPVRWYDEPVDEVVGGAQPGLEHRVQVVGEVDVVRDGLTTTLRLTGTSGGASLLFTDPAPGIADWRVLFVDRAAAGTAVPGAEAPDDDVAGPDVGGTLRLDLNRTLNLPYAFTEFGTCPRPVEGNVLPFSVEAGEKVPR